MRIDITFSGVVFRDLEYSLLDEDGFLQWVESVLRRVETATGLKLEGAFEYDHICKTLRVDYDNDRNLPTHIIHKMDVLADELTREFSGG